MSENGHLTDHQLLARIALGDEKAFSGFYERTAGQLYNAVMVYTKDHDVAREILQVCYIRIWNRRHELQQIQNLKNYLFILARNAAFSHFKKVTVQHRLLSRLKEQAGEQDEPAGIAIEEKESYSLYRHVIAHLPRQQRQAYLLRVDEQLDYDEIAEQMQVSRFTVKRHLELARRFVRKQVRHYLQQELLPLVLFCLSVVCVR